jgi:hypothetical protein
LVVIITVAVLVHAVVPNLVCSGVSVQVGIIAIPLKLRVAVPVVVHVEVVGAWAVACDGEEETK